MKFMSCACLFGLLCCIVLPGSMNALPITSDEPSSELVIQCGVPSEFSVTTSVSRTASHRDTIPSGSESHAAVSPVATPEPSTVGLISLGLGCVAACRLMRRTRPLR